jgi:threonine synthase
MAAAEWWLECDSCGRQTESSELAACANCGEATVIRYAALPQTLASPNTSGIWRYRDWLPIAAQTAPISLGEGETPIVRLDRWAGQIGLRRVYAKLEFAGPTGSFKDRGAAVLVTHCVESGARVIIEDSSGNAGAALAAYAARAGLECKVFAPAATPAAKLHQVRVCGATVVTVAGDREDVAIAAQAAARSGHRGDYYAGHNSNPYFVEGMKSFAFELAEHREAGVVDHVVMPVGGGSLYCGAALGFGQMRQAGLRAAHPRMHLVQAAACMPIVAAFDRHEDRPPPVQPSPSIAGGILIANPPRGRMILRILGESDGSAVAVTEEEILAAQTAVARLEGISMEPTSAAAFAGLARLARSGAVGPDEVVVVPVTGSGLKDQMAVSNARP